MLSDAHIAALIERARDGGRADFAQVVRALAPSIGHYFALHGLGPDGAEECLQETFLRAYQALGTYSSATPFRAWLYGIARNVRLQELRQRRRHRHEAADELPDALARPDERLADDDERRALREALAELPERMRLALQLRFIEGRSCAEIAAALDTTVVAVSPLLYRAKAALKERLDRRGQAAPMSRGGDG